MIRKSLVFAGLLAGAVQASAAMPLAQAGESLLYFEHARVSTEHCERQGFAVRPAFDAWWRAHAELHRAVLEGLRSHAAGKGLSRDEQEQVITQIHADHRRKAQDHVASKGVSCGDFGGHLQMYSTLLRRWG